MDGWMNGWFDGCMYGWMDGYFIDIYISYFAIHTCVHDIYVYMQTIFLAYILRECLTTTTFLVFSLGNECAHNVCVRKCV